MRILYIDIDSLRPDHLGCYGYHRNTSPAIDALARESLLCRNVYASDAPCLPSRTAFYAGRFGIHSGVVGHGGTAAQPKVEGRSRDFCDRFWSEGLAGCLLRAGFHTAMISPFGQRHSAWHFYAGFKEIHNTGGGGMESAEEIDPVLEKWLGDHMGRDGWFLHLNFWDPHTPYRVPMNYGNPFALDPLPEWLNDEELIRRHNLMAGPHTSLDLAMYSDREDPKYPRHPGKITDLASMRKMIDGYDTAVRYVDDRVAGIVARLKAAGIYEDTAIIISADHGENLGELGIYGEHGTADAITCRVPMIIKWPGGAKGKEESGLRYGLDLAPTLADLLGFAAPERWDGESFAEAVMGGETGGREDLVLSQCAHVCQRSVRWGDWLYLRTYHDGFHLFPQELLFNLRDDPYEQKDLAESRPELCREGQWRLSRWWDAQMLKMARGGEDPVDPLWRVIREGGPFHARMDEPGQPGVMGFLEYLQRLDGGGRRQGADVLRERYAWELPRLESL